MKFLKLWITKAKTLLLFVIWLTWTILNCANCYYQNILFKTGSMNRIYHFLIFPMIGRVWDLNNNLIQMQLLIYLILSIIVTVMLFNQFLLKNNKKQIYSCLLIMMTTISSLITITNFNQKAQTKLSTQICQKNTIILQTADNEYKRQGNKFYIKEKAYSVANAQNIKTNKNAKFDAPLIQVSQRKWKPNANQEAISIYQKINKDNNLNQYTSIEINN